MPTYIDWPSESGGGGSGTVTIFSFTSANGINGIVTNPTTTPNLTLSLGAITPTSVAASGTVTGSNLSGINTGDVTLGTANGLSLLGQILSLQLSSAGTTGALSSTDWSTFNSKQPAGNYITDLTGDATATGPGSAPITLATVNSNVGSFTNANITVNAKGLITAASSGTAGTVTSVALTTPSFLTVAGSPITTSGTLAVTLTTQTANKVFAGPTSGSAAAPTFRALIGTDINPAQALSYFGDGSDGDVTISSGVTLVRDMYYNNLTIAAGAALNTAGYRIFVLGTLDLTAAPANSIFRTVTNGNNASAATLGTGGAALASNTLGGSGAGANGANGANNNATAGSNAAATTGNGGSGGVAGAGGPGTGLGGAGGSVTAATTARIRHWATYFLRGVTLLVGGQGGSGGGGAGGSGASAGGGGGGGGSGGGFIAIFAQTISRGGSTAASAIAVNGGAGGNGGNGVGATNCGGGGGGGGAGGGWIYIAYGALTGTTATNALTASGGAGGTGGNASTSATGGTGGASGAGGSIQILDLGTQTLTHSTGSASVAGSAPSGVTGGAGAATNTFQVSL